MFLNDGKIKLENYLIQVWHTPINVFVGKEKFFIAYVLWQSHLKFQMDLVVGHDPLPVCRFPGDELSSGREPHADLLLSRLKAVGSVDGVTANGDAVLTTDGARSSIKRRCGTKHNASLTDDISTFPDLYNIVSLHQNQRSICKLLQMVTL
jgi:hypothetical protein